MSAATTVAPGSSSRSTSNCFGLRDYPNGGEGVITLAGVEHCFMYVVQNDVVDTVVGPPDYIEQVFNAGRARHARRAVCAAA